MVNDDEVRSLFSGQYLPRTPDELRRLRVEEPIVRLDSDKQHVWMLTRRNDTRAMLSDLRFSRVPAGAGSQPLPTLGLLSSIDPPRHTFLRKLVSGAFSACAVERWQDRVRAHAERLLAVLSLNTGPTDLYRHYCLPLAMKVTSDVTGFPERLHEENQLWTHEYLERTSWSPRKCAESRQRQSRFVEAAIGDRRRNPGDDSISELIKQCDAGLISEDELWIVVASLHVTGHVKTATQLAGSLLVLLNRPDDLALLRSNPSLVMGAVEELLRFIPVAQLTHPRFATAEVSLGDVVVRPGDVMFASIASANHDGTAFDEADRIRLRRGPTAHMTFGHGRHFCIGSVLARLILQVGITAVVNHFPHLRCVAEVDALPWMNGFIAHGLVGLPVSAG